MTRVSHINELYGGNEALERLQRRDARFFNTCMMMTASAAGVRGLDDGRVVSGVGGQLQLRGDGARAADGAPCCCSRDPRAGRRNALKRVVD
jgi:hypothetical protein